MASVRSVNVNIRARDREARAWRAAAKRSDETLSEWIRKLCNGASVLLPPPRPPVVSGDQIELPLNGRSRKRGA